MNQMITKGLFIAGIALLTVPATVQAQKEKVEKEQKEKKEKQHISIMRNGNTNEKMVIEIEGDKVKVNGKDVKDQKDLEVHVNTMSGDHFFHSDAPNIYRDRVAQGGNWNMNYNDDDHMSLFSEDNNRAMLGVVTEGDEKGAEIMSVTKASAAEKAGLKKGDILTKIGDKTIESTEDVTEAIHARKPGEKIVIAYIRDGKVQNATAELGKWKGIRMNAVKAPQIQGLGDQFNGQMDQLRMFEGNKNTFVLSPSRPRLGLSIQDTDDGVGVKVLDVDEESNAAKAGIKEGDVIMGVNDHEVKSTDDVTKAMKEKEKFSFNFKIQRNGKTQNIEVKMPRKLKTANL